MRGFYGMSNKNGSVIPDLIGDPSSEFENTGFPIKLGMTGKENEDNEDFYDDDEEDEKEWCD